MPTKLAVFLISMAALFVGAPAHAYENLSPTTRTPAHG